MLLSWTWITKYLDMLTQKTFQSRIIFWWRYLGWFFWT